MGMRHGETKVAGDKAFARIRKHGRRGPFGRRSASKSLCAVLAAAMLVFAGAGLYGCSASGGSSDRTPVRLQIFAANSLSGAMAEATAAYSRTHSWVSFADTQFLSSGDLAMQLRVGAYADVIISASSDKMDTVESFGGIKEGTRFDLFDNNLILVTRKGSGITADTLGEAIGKGYSICIGDETVPAGNYARQVLYSLGHTRNPKAKAASTLGLRRCWILRWATCASMWRRATPTSALCTAPIFTASRIWIPSVLSQRAHATTSSILRPSARFPTTKLPPRNF